MVGGGFPGGGIGGKSQFMDIAGGKPIDVARPSRSGRVAQLSGTFWGNPVTTAAGYAALSNFTEEAITRTSGQLERLDVALSDASSKSGLPYCSRRIGSMMTVWFQDELPAANQLRAESPHLELFHLAMHNNGLMKGRRSLINVSTQTTDRDIAEIIQRLEAAVSDLAAEV
jgi:glutamate-1-semialdehyde 2,1-aminomutase